MIMAYKPEFRSEEERRLYERMLKDGFRPRLSSDPVGGGRVVYKGPVADDVRARSRRLKADGKLVVIDDPDGGYNGEK